MAEAAGLAVGVVSLVGLTSSIIRTVQLVSNLDDYEDDHRMEGAVLTLTAARFARWNQGAFPQGEGSVRDIPHVENAQKILETIDQRFTEARQLLGTHGDDSGESTELAADTAATTLVVRLRHTAKSLFKSPRFGRTAKRARWIITDRDQLRIVCSQLATVIEQLEKLVPTTSVTADEAMVRALARELEARRDFQQVAEEARTYDPRLFHEMDINRQLVLEGHVDITGLRTGKNSQVHVGTRITERIARVTDLSRVMARDARVGKGSIVRAGFQVT